MKSTESKTPAACTDAGRVAEKIAGRYAPKKIYLYNHRVNVSGHIYAFKLCVVMDAPNKHEVEHDIYLSIDCDVPFDLILYTPEEWDAFSNQPGKFAYRIKQTGVLLYDAP